MSNDTIKSILSDIESLDSLRDKIETHASDAQREADDACDEACEAGNQAETASNTASEARDNAQQAASYADDMSFQLSELHERVSELMTDDNDDSDELTELKRNNELLESALKFERAKFARIVQFVQAIADESITLDDNSETSESESS